ncbi:MAG: hypothetical protein IPO16_06745 [Saprospiraceae bacterium]|nr:hypothetical protein [Saprospiraceae bacterium]
MKKSIIILAMATTGFFSCGQSSKSTSDTVNTGTLNSTENIQSQKSLANYNEKYIDTKYEYTDSIGMNLIIQNSLPRGGLKYTDPNGKEYVYAIFWTRIINETVNPFEFTINFLKDSYELPSSPGRYFRILLPTDTMTLDKEPLFNYGLTDLESFLDNGIHKSSSLKRIINPNKSSNFYVVTLFNLGVDGTLRTGLNLKEQNLFYRINDKEIHCGKINLKNLLLQK